MSKIRKEKTGDTVRPYKLSHQTLSLTGINFQRKSIIGCSEISITPLKEDLKCIRLNSRQCRVYRVSFNDVIDVPFFYFDPFADIYQENEHERSLEKFQVAHLQAALLVEPDNNNGELVITIPPEAVGEHFALDKVLKIIVEFSLEQPSGGVHFVVPDCEGTLEKRGAHLYTVSHENSSRLWFPCVDSFAEPCTWNLEITVDLGMIAISCGDLVDIVFTQDMRRKTYYYTLNVPTSAPNIGMAVGPFEIYVDPFRNEISYFCLPGVMENLKTSTRFVHEILDFYEETLSVLYPYSCYKLVFVDETEVDVASYSTLGLLSIGSLHPSQVIDQAYETRKWLALAIAQQFYGCFISRQNWSDWWLTNGISAYLAGLYSKKSFGGNSYQESILKNLQDVLEYEKKYGGIVMDPHSQISSCSQVALGTNSKSQDTSHYHFPTRNIHTMSPEYLKVVMKKAHLVIRMLESRIGYLLLLQVLNKLLSLASVASGQTQNCLSWGSLLISTNVFTKAIYTVTGKDITVFIDQWVRTGGHARFHLSLAFNRKRNTLEVEVKQDGSHHKGVRKYTGPLDIVVQELDGSFKHTLAIEGAVSRSDITCHSKSRRNKKKKIPLWTGEEVDMDLSLMDTDSPVLWVRVDASMNLIRDIILDQPDYQWQFQLKYEKDVIAQLDALTALEKFPTHATRQTLTDIIENENIYVNIRCKAAHSLTKVSNAIVTDFMGPSPILSLFRKMFGSFACPHITRLNNFSSLPHYFIQKEIPKAVAGLRNNHGICPPDVLKFLLDLLRYNDNSKNRFSDNYYRASLIEALGATVTPVMTVMQQGSDITAESLSADTKLILEDITLSLNLEKVLPTYKLTVTIACLKAIRMLQKFGHLPNNPSIFRSYATYGQYVDVRLCALEALVDYTKLDGTWEDLEYLLEIAIEDSDRKIRYSLVRLICDNPPFQRNLPSTNKHRLDKEDLVHKLWLTFNNLLSYDSRMRCNLIDLYFTLYGKRVPSCLPTADGNSYKIHRNLDFKMDMSELDRTLDRLEEDPLVHGIKRLSNSPTEKVPEIITGEVLGVATVDIIAAGAEDVKRIKLDTGPDTITIKEEPGIRTASDEEADVKVFAEPLLVKQENPEKEQTTKKRHHHHHHHHHHRHHHHKTSDGKKKKKEKKKHKHKHKHDHKHTKPDGKVKEEKKEEENVVIPQLMNIKEENLSSDSSTESDSENKAN